MEKGLSVILENNSALCGKLARIIRAKGHADAHARVEAWVRCMICKAHEPALDMSLPPALNKVWHLALLQTREYAALCADIGGIFVHHSTNAEDQNAVERVETLRKTYFSLFGKPAPTDGFWSVPTKKRTRAQTEDDDDDPRGKSIIYLKWNGDIAAFLVKFDYTLAKLKDMIHRKTGVEPRQQYLFYKSRFISSKSEFTLSQLGIGALDAIVMLN